MDLITLRQNRLIGSFYGFRGIIKRRFVRRFYYLPDNNSIVSLSSIMSSNLHPKDAHSLSSVLSFAPFMSLSPCS